MLSRPIPRIAKAGVLGAFSIILLVVAFLAIVKALIGERYVATLPDGTTLELLGVCEHPSVKRQWWRPDGSMAKGEALADFVIKSPHYVPGLHEQNRVFAVGLGRSNLREMKLTWELPESIKSHSCIACDDEEGQLLKPTQSVVAEFPPGVQHTDVVIGVAAGKWKTVALGANGRTEADTNDSLADGPVTFHEVIQQEDNVELSATHVLGPGYDCRIAVVDLANEVHEPTKRSNSESDLSFCCKGAFDLSPDQIKLVRLEARPYEYVVFKNVSLHGGLKTDFQIEVLKTRGLQTLYDEFRAIGSGSQ